VSRPPSARTGHISTVAACEEATEDLKGAGIRLGRALALLRSPLQFAYHVGHDLVVNGQDILKEVEGAEKDYESQDWEAFGKDVGEALEKLLVGDSTTATMVV
jgi:hypothetical protein